MKKSSDFQRHLRWRPFRSSVLTHPPRLLLANPNSIMSYPYSALSSNSSASIESTEWGGSFWTRKVRHLTWSNAPIWTLLYRRRPQSFLKFPLLQERNDWWRRSTSHLNIDKRILHPGELEGTWLKVNAKFVSIPIIFINNKKLYWCGFSKV